MAGGHWLDLDRTSVLPKSRVRLQQLPVLLVDDRGLALRSLRRAVSADIVAPTKPPWCDFVFNLSLAFCRGARVGVAV